MDETATGSRNPVDLGLPHREPFIFVDVVTDLQPGERAAGQKRFGAGDPIFRGHFPGEPIVPGVLLAEALAQLAGCAAAQAGSPLKLAAIRGMKFPSAAKPEETIELRAEKTASAGGLWHFTVEARVGERVVAEGAIVLGG